MKKAIFQKLYLVIFVLLLCGCQILGLQSSDEELIYKTMGWWKEAMETKNVDRLLAIYSDSYKTSEGDDKETMRVLVQRSFESGFMETVEINMEKARAIVAGNRAKFGPIEFISDTGTWPMELTLQEENKNWLIVSSRRLGQ